MKSCSKLFALTLVCFALVACGKSAEEKAVAAASNSKDANLSRQAMPDCAKRGTDGKFINSVGCTDADWAAWRAAGN